MTNNSSIHELENWLGEFRPQFFRDLPEGASENEVAELQSIFSKPIPLSFWDYLRWHNGQPLTGPAFMKNKRLMSTKEIIKTWRIFKELDYPQKYWGNQWLPFLEDGNGNYICINLENGEILEFWKSDDDRPIIASHFDSWILKIVDEFKSKKWHEYRDSFLPEEDIKIYQSWDVVEIVINKIPEAGLRAIKEINDLLKTGIGTTNIFTELKSGRSVVLCRKKLCEISGVLKIINDKFGQDTLAVITKIHGDP
ncbi:MAG: hypothetical protein RL095_1689 [Verrucomicrobiota bacterium]|jgi:cell wall assembly regulator SMI1